MSQRRKSAVGGSDHLPSLGRVERPVPGRQPVKHAIRLAATILSVFAITHACTTPARKGPPRKIVRQSIPESLVIPVDGVSRADLLDSFGHARSGDRRHDAIDIFAPRNTPVRSTVDGWIRDRRTLSLGGKTVSVTGPGGQRHYYAHLERWGSPRPGNRVDAGEIIGYVGNSGNARGLPTHLHYAVYDTRGRAINPYPLLMAGPGPFGAGSLSE